MATDDRPLTLASVREPQKGPEAAKLWHSRLTRALRFRETRWNGPKAWRAALRLAKGDHWRYREHGDSDELASDLPADRITVNLAGSVAQDYEAYLMRSAPRFRGNSPVDPAKQTIAELQAELLNYFWSEQRMQLQAKRAVRDIIQLGTGIVRTAWITRLDESINPGRDGLVDYRDIVKDEMPVIYRVSPFRFVFSPDAPQYDLESARWCAEIIVLPVSDLLAMKKYNDDSFGGRLLAKVKSGAVSPTFYDQFELQGRAASELQEMMGPSEEDDHLGSKLAVVFNVWDKKHQSNFHLLAGAEEDFLFYQDWPYPYLDGFPYIMGKFIEMNDEHLGRGLLHDIKDQQFELNRIRTSKFQHRRKLGRTLYQALEVVPNSEIVKLATGKDGEVVRVPTIGAIQRIDSPTLPSEVDRLEDTIKQDIRELSGQNAMMSGAPLPSRTTAAEVNKRATYSDMKLEDRVNTVDDFILRIGTQVLQHAKANMQRSKVVRIVGPWGNEWPELTPEDIKEEVDLELQSTSTPRGFSDLERQTATTLVQHVIQNLPLLTQAGVTLNIVELFKWLFRKYGAEKEIGRFFPGIGEPPGPQLPYALAAELAGGMASPASPEVPAMDEEQIMAQQEGVQPESIAQGSMGDLGAL